MVNLNQIPPQSQVLDHELEVLQVSLDKTIQTIDSAKHNAIHILSARLKLLESYKLIFKTKVPENKKENIYLLTKKGIRLTPTIIEFSLWGNSNMREFNEIDDIEGLNSDKSFAIQSVQDSYSTMLNSY